MKRHVSMIIRLVLAGVMLRFVYDETGVWTVALLALITISPEIQVELWRRLKDPNAW